MHEQQRCRRFCHALSHEGHFLPDRGGRGEGLIAGMEAVPGERV
jgi:hypothetical protein